MKNKKRIIQLFPTYLLALPPYYENKLIYPLIKTYKVIFANNIVLAISETVSEYIFNGDTHCHIDNGVLTEALIKQGIRKKRKTKRRN